MTANSKLYNKIVLRGPNQDQKIPGTRTYKGFSTVALQANSFSLFDFDLIKQDILNHFNIRQGEKLENPEFGTIIWDVLFEPLTNDLQDLIRRNVETIINYDPRVNAEEVIVTSYESGIQIECVITYLPYNVSESLQLKFDRDNSILQ